MPEDPQRHTLAESSDFYIWEVPGQRVRVRIAFDALDRVLVEGLRGLGLVPRRGAEVGGVLLGRVERGDIPTVQVQDIVPVPTEYASGPSFTPSPNDLSRFRKILTLHAGRVVGFYRTCNSEQLRFGESDQALFRELFSEPSSVALLVQPKATRASAAGFFIWEGDTVRETSHLEFQVQARTGLRRAAEEVERQAATEAAPEPAPPTLATPAPEPPLPSFLSAGAIQGEPGRSRIPGLSGLSVPAWYSWWVQIPLLAGLLLVHMTLGYAAARHFSIRSQQARALRDPYSLSLVVLEYGENLHLRWDRDAPALSSATGGVLSISDGERNRTLDLSSAHLRAGSVTYRRLTPLVRFKLEVMIGGRRSIAESWDASAQKPAGAGQAVPASTLSTRP